MNIRSDSWEWLIAVRLRVLNPDVKIRPNDVVPVTIGIVSFSCQIVERYFPDYSGLQK